MENNQPLDLSDNLKRAILNFADWLKSMRNHIDDVLNNPNTTLGYKFEKARQLINRQKKEIIFLKEGALKDSTFNTTKVQLIVKTSDCVLDCIKWIGKHSITQSEIAINTLCKYIDTTIVRQMQIMIETIMANIPKVTHSHLSYTTESDPNQKTEIIKDYLESVKNKNHGPTVERHVEELKNYVRTTHDKILKKEYAQIDTSHIIYQLLKPLLDRCINLQKELDEKEKERNKKKKKKRKNIWIPQAPPAPEIPQPVVEAIYDVCQSVEDLEKSSFHANKTGFTNQIIQQAKKLKTVVKKNTESPNSPYKDIFREVKRRRENMNLSTSSAHSNNWTETSFSFNK